MAHLGKIIGITAALTLTAGAGGILAAVNVEAQEGAARIHANTVEMTAAYDKFSEDTRFSTIADRIAVEDGGSFVSTKDTITSGFIGADILGPVYALLPGTQALVSAAEENDLISQKYVEEDIQGKIEAQKEAQRLCSLMENNTVSVLLSSDENKDFISSGNVPANISHYLEYCDPTSANFEAASSTTTE